MQQLFTISFALVLAMLATGELTQAGTPTLPPAQPTITAPPKPGEGLTLLGQPEVTNTIPAEYAVQGEPLRFIGSLAPHQFHAQIAGADLPIIQFGPGSTPASFIRVRIPDNLVTSGSPLVVWYGINGPKRTLNPAFKVLKKARVTSFQLKSPATIDFDQVGRRSTRIEIELADFDPTVETFSRPSLWSLGCLPAGQTIATGRGPSEEDVLPSKRVVGNPSRFVYDFNFIGAELSGRRCAMEIRPYGSNQAPVPAGEVTLPTVATYVISNTADLLNFTSPSGTRITATASKGVLPCQLASVGTAGTFATGVVMEGNDLSFQLRNGLLREDCEFQTSNGLAVKDGWFLKAVDWQFTRDSLCTANEFGYQFSSGSLVTFFRDSTAIFKVRFQATCMPDSKNSTQNSHLYKARLASVQLIGPAGQQWQDAFK